MRSPLLPFFLIILSYSLAAAQQVYTGARVALFNPQILQQNDPTISLRCSLANTGRQMVGTKTGPADLCVEFDTLSLPALLRGHEAEMAEAVRGNCPKLKPGEVSGEIWLSFRIKPVIWTASGGCADLAFDTAYVEAWGKRTMELRFVLKNSGTAPAHFFAKKTEPLVNVYFVSGSKLTRGAIPAGNTQIRKGQETLDGVLLPGQYLEGSVVIDLKNRSKFSPNIALEFDPAQAVDECSRAGNVWVVPLRY